MGISRLKRWHWLIAGIGCGLVFALLYGEPGPPAGARRAAVEPFINDLTAPAAGGQPVVSNIKVYPPHEDVYLVTFVHAEASDVGVVSEPRYIYAKTPFTSQTAETVRDYFRRASVSYSYAWWTTTGWRCVWFSAVGALLVGGIWGAVVKRFAKPQADESPMMDLSRYGKETAPIGKREPSEAELQHLRELEAELESAQGTPPTVASPAAPSPANEPVKLDGGPLTELDEQAKQDKDYRGEFYPTERGGRPKPHGFSLIELLVVIGIIGILVAILIPMLRGARQASYTIACAANLRSIGQAMNIYLVENRDTYPAAYLYIGHSIVNDEQTPTTPEAGYVHWSSYLYGSGKMPKTAFLCPSMNRGGLPPTNTSDDNLDPGQNVANKDVIDQQAPRLAYTVNEAICPRNKFVAGATPFQGALRTYRFVKAGEIGNSSGTILGTEWVDNGLLISKDMGATGWIMSHRPIHGFVGSDGEIDMYRIAPGAGFRRATIHDLDPDPETEASTETRLDWVGRNHGEKRGYPDRRKTNFLYADGHVVTKTIYETIAPKFEWGEKFYSLVRSDDLAAP